MNDDFQRLDRVLAQLVRVFDAPGQEADGSAEPIWQKLDLFYESMGADALRALLRRQGMGATAIEDALNVLDRRRGSMS